MPIRTLSDLVFRIREVSAGRPALLAWRSPEGREVVSAHDFLRNVHSLALALEAQGVAPGERVALFSENRPEWHTVDFACHLLGAPTVPLHPRLSAEQAGYVLRNSGARWVFYSDAAKRRLLDELRASLTVMPRAVAFAGDATLPDGVSFTRLLGLGAERRGEVPIERFRGRLDGAAPATILYASDTSGEPQGEVLTHDAIVSGLRAAAARLDLGPRDLSLSSLPLSHPFQRLVDYLCFLQGASICYVAEEDQVAAVLAEVRPTVMVAAPRLFEQIFATLVASGDGAAAWRRWLFQRAVAVGHEHAAARRRGFVGPWLALRRKTADLLVLRRLRRRFGGRLRYAIAGGAPLDREVVDFFTAVGLPVHQGDGLTATSLRPEDEVAGVEAP